MTASECDCSMSKICEIVNNGVKKNYLQFNQFDKVTVDLMSFTFKVGLSQEKPQTI